MISRKGKEARACFEDQVLDVSPCLRKHLKGVETKPYQWKLLHNDCGGPEEFSSTSGLPAGAFLGARAEKRIKRQRAE